MPPVPPRHPPTVIEVYTPFFVGTFLNVFLYGIAVTQMYTYYRTSQDDKLWMKMLVAYLLVMETINSILDVGLIFEPLLLNFGNPNVIATSPWTLRLDGVTTTLISTPVQIFMAWRIQKIMGTVIPTVVVTILALSSLIGSVWLAIAVSQSPQYAKFDEFKGAPSLWLISSAVADIAIAGCLVYGLSKKRTGFAVLNDQIDRIIRVTVQTGSLTALTALIDVIVFLSVPNTTIFFAWDLMLSKLYTTTLLSSFNARPAKLAVRARLDEPSVLFSSKTGSAPLQLTSTNSHQDRWKLYQLN
ncbi:hypothetical protein GYMLUDRAFT_469764 [Collybiopsis luxurians FD-317 M1]|uniref:DUF6534 domain-containing protein n=1 Tax=Collybiopsis luxurians FD-317 M1 TaxID=944289 RepID=A0A0D0BXS7_9AGAR|nr:hypothetical protein GYMLUDRAFT_469764 [Collybiopsis luxurians FD-317 M1]